MKPFLMLMVAFLGLACWKNPHAGTSPAPNDLAGALEFFEHVTGSGEFTIGSSEHRALVDYKSKLKIVPNASAIQGLSKREVLPALAGADSIRLIAIDTLMETARDYLEYAQATLEALRAAGSAPDAASRARLSAMIREQATKGLAVVTPVREIAEARADAEGITGEDERVTFVASLTRRILRNAQGNRVLLNVDGLSDFLADEIEFAVHQHTSDTEIAETMGAVRFRMRAWLYLRGGDRTAVSIAGYDEIESFIAPKRPRIAFQMTEQERLRVEEGYELANKASQFVENVAQDAQAFKRDITQVLRQAVTDLDEVLGRIDRLDTWLDGDAQASLTLLIEAAVASTVISDEEKGQLQELQDFVEELATWFADVRKAFTDIRAEIAGRRTAVDVFTGVPQAAVTRLFSIGEALQAQVTAVQTLTAVVGRMAGEEAERVKEDLDEVADATIGRLTAVLEGLGALESVYEGLSRMEVIGLAHGFDRREVDPRVKALTLDAITPGTVDLNRTPADRGDELEIYAELFTIGDNGQEEVLQHSGTTFRIDRFGVTTEIKPSLVFVRRSGQRLDDAGQLVDYGWTTAPGTSLTFHLRERPTGGFFSNAFRFIDPGVGMNVATLAFDDGTIQIGIGAQASIIDDLFFGGYGYNLGADQNHDYWFFGIGLLKAFGAAGDLVRSFKKGGSGT